MNQIRTGRRRERGSALAAAIVFAVVCASLAGSTMLMQAGRRAEVRTDWASERAFALAESGIDWGLAVVRDRRGNVTGLSDVTMAVAGTGEFTVRYGPGETNGIDDDADGSTDESDESRFQVLSATGRSDGVARTLTVLLLSENVMPGFDAGTIVNVDSPIVDLGGNAFEMSGYEHFINGTVDTTRTAKWAIASAAAPAVVAAQIAALNIDQVVGSGTLPSIKTTAAIDLPAIMAAAQAAATIRLSPGTNASVSLGTPTSAGVEVVRCDGDLHLTGNGSGAGVLIVDGDLTISGGFEWVGIVIVRGSLDMVGGGSGKRFIGTLIVAEELRVRGTVDLLFSTDAVVLASSALIVPRILTWRETGTP